MRSDKATAEVAHTIQEKLKATYETIRTVSVLPGVVDIESPGQKLASDTSSSIQQIYNNAFLNIQLSEIYILPKNFNYLNISPITQKPEEPLAVFDSLITQTVPERRTEANNSTNALVPETESFEYSLHREQFEVFNKLL